LFFNLYVHRELSLPDTYRKMLTWLSFAGLLPWRFPAMAAPGDTAEVRDIYVQFAFRCYQRHLNCTDACRACCGTIGAQRALHMPALPLPAASASAESASM
jgi:hypothetical protein